jgi:hypothetical protein
MNLPFNPGKQEKDPSTQWCAASGAISGMQKGTQKISVMPPDDFLTNRASILPNPSGAENDTDDQQSNRHSRPELIAHAEKSRRQLGQLFHRQSKRHQYDTKGKLPQHILSATLEFFAHAIFIGLSHPLPERHRLNDGGRLLFFVS